MMMDIAGKVAIVTGASSGIGLATAVELSRQGASVALVARSRDRLEALAAKLPNSFSIATDMTDEDQVRVMVDQAARHYGRLDILVNNAGRGAYAPLAQLPTADFRALFALNLLGPLVAMQAAIPVMLTRGEGAIVNVSSGTSLMAIPNLGGYSSLKRALNGLSLTARAELVGDGIVVSVVYPYVTSTDFGRNALGSGDGQIQPGRRADDRRPPPDTAEYVAEKIIEAITTGAAEVYAHDWIRQTR